MKQIVAGLVTAVLLGVVLFFGRRDKSAPAVKKSATPEACVERMFTAAEAGDLDAYRDCLAGQQLDQFERSGQGQTPDAIRQSLRASVAGLKGHVVHLSPTGDAAKVQLQVERVYAHHNQLQVFELVRSGEQWRIESIRSSGNQPPPVPYGTPVFPGLDESQR